jgi:hypothetical protein
MPPEPKAQSPKPKAQSLKKLVERPVGLLLLSIVVGLINAVLLMGWAIINPTNVAWLTGDNATHHLGWAFYRYESGWAFPLAWTDRVGYPAGTSIAFLDSVPLVAVLLRPLSAILPEPFQYLGPYGALCFVLQAYFGFSISRRLSSGDPVFTILGGLFFLLSPPLTWQLFGHYPHLGQWLILAGIDSYLRDTTAVSPTMWVAPLWVVLALAAGINPYFAAMGFLIALAGIGRLIVECRCGWRIGVLLLALTPAVLFGGLLTIGFLIARDPSSYWAPGYGDLSLNLLAPINPMSFGSIVFPPLPITNGGQWEGYNYLGAGIIALLVLGLVRGLRPLLWMFDRKLVPLLCLALACTAAAVSSTVSFGSTILLQFDLPKPLAAVAESLRVSGRLFWPAHYLLIASAISLMFWRWKPPYRSAILGASLALQIADLGQLRHHVRTLADQVIENPLRSPVWQQLGRNYDNLIVVPAYQCGPYAAPGGPPTYRIFGMLAAAQKMRTNSFYAARYTKPEMYVHCRDVPGEVLSGKLDSRTAYVVSDGVRTVLDMSRAPSHRCETVDGFNLCTAANGRTPEAVRWKPKPIPYPSRSLTRLGRYSISQPPETRGRTCCMDGRRHPEPTAPGLRGRLRSCS